MTLKIKAAELFKHRQSEICRALEELDGGGAFLSDTWQRPDMSGHHGGGGTARVMKKGNVFEQAGVNYSEVYGNLPPEMGAKLVGRAEALPFSATGVSLVLHPWSPMVPTVHANFRYLEVAERKWFGGGTDLTPYYLFEEDATHFHSVLRSYCERHDPSYYPRFKRWCDEYFYLPHRKEARGIGGIFFDYLGKDDPEGIERYFEFSQDISSSFLPAYLPIVERRRNMEYSDHHRDFQLLRRGRYVEFNLLHDRGTQFGLQTGGRTESILMSLPPQVRFEYNAQIQPGSIEAKLIEVLTSPRDW